MLNSREKLLFLCTTAFVIALPVSWKVLNRGDRLDKEQRLLAGTGAVDCGVGRIKTSENNLIFEDRLSADDCAVAAFKAKKPFFVRYDSEAEEDLAHQSLGIVRTPQGQVHFTYYEFYPVWYRSTVQYVQAVCPAPSLMTHFGKRGKRWQQVGCGTCASMGSEDTANCIIHPLKP